ncbi:GDSL-type esterase/lipase family protein [uncultured Sphingomonas sp.]|uniref:GDSL-type esterase/lipase family protein n=1 Tax=uncultured Sphingomonas sp. TaxID=158754 RepID=UPI0025F72515|nr:GDSL-type esterase/lipase family protein [uncultured Sphingomonas sp.]
MSALFALALAQAASAQACIGGLCDAERLRPFLEKLASAKEAPEPVRILQIGDSHTAGDQITGSWRTALQTRFGRAGRGVLPPGRPYAGYLTRDITAGQSIGWSVNGIFGAAYSANSNIRLGLSGYSLTSEQPGATVTLSADNGRNFDRLTVCALSGPGQGSLQLSLGAAVVAWSLDGAQAGSRCRTLDGNGEATIASATVIGGPVTITSWSTERRMGGGVILSNLGTVGAQFLHFGRTDDRVVATELAAYRPDLIVVAYGTNEAFRPGFSASAYEATLRADLTRLRRLAPDVPMLLIGAPDSATKQPGLQSGESGTSAPCADGGGWRPTAALASVQAVQRRQARAFGIAYWDWAQRMGGRCVADGWTQGATPLMRGDHVHFTSRGGAEIARLLQADLDAAMTRIAGATPQASWSTTAPSAPVR